MAGTGGTSSSNMPAELCTFRGFGVGSREVDITWLFLELAPPLAAARREPAEVDEMGMPGLFAFDAKSGVLHDDEGVTPRDTMAGERAAGRRFGLSG